MAKFRILNFDQVFAFKNNLEIIQKSGSMAMATDFSILLGLYLDDDAHHFLDDDNIIAHFGPWWIDGDMSTLKASVDEWGHPNMIYPDFSRLGCRPVVSYSSVSSDCSSLHLNENDVYECTYGEYPKSKINENIDGEKLVRTGKEFTVKQNGKFVKLFELVDELGNKMVVVNGNFYKVEPLVWVVSSYKDIMITKDAINGGFAYENALTEEEEAYAACMDRLIHRKMSQRNIMIAEKSRNDNTLANNFLRNIMSNEIINEEMINKIRERNKEQARKEAEEKARLEAIKKEKRRL